MKKIFSLLIIGSGLFINTAAQDSLQVTAETQSVSAARPKFTKATFKSTRIINMQSVEMVSKGTLQFMISHHFGYAWNKDLGSPRLFNKNLSQLFGFNSGIAHTYLSLDYSPLNCLNIGAAATGSSQFEGWVKIKLLRQQTGTRNIPVTVVLFSQVALDASPRAVGDFTGNKFSFMHQLLIARKFSDKFSLQLMPTVIHFNLVPYGINNSNYVYSMGIGGKYKLSSKKSLTFEYARQLNMYQNLLDKSGNIYQYAPDLLSIGIEFDTGGHLFQFFVGNTLSSTNIDQLARNTSKIGDGKFALGFTINRGFSLKK